MEKHELSAIDFKLIDDAFKALLQSNPEPVTADKIKDLRNMFYDAYTGWLEIYDEAALFGGVIVYAANPASLLGPHLNPPRYHSRHRSK